MNREVLHSVALARGGVEVKVALLFIDAWTSIQLGPWIDEP